jgi:hypothetical protein
MEEDTLTNKDNNNNKIMIEIKRTRSNVDDPLASFDTVTSILLNKLLFAVEKIRIYRLHLTSIFFNE